MAWVTLQACLRCCCCQHWDVLRKLPEESPRTGRLTAECRSTSWSDNVNLWLEVSQTHDLSIVSESLLSYACMKRGMRCTWPRCLMQPLEDHFADRCKIPRAAGCLTNSLECTKNKAVRIEQWTYTCWTKQYARCLHEHNQHDGFIMQCNMLLWVCMLLACCFGISVSNQRFSISTRTALSELYQPDRAFVFTLAHEHKVWMHLEVRCTPTLANEAKGCWER